MEYLNLEASADPEENKVLDALQDYLGNGGHVPSDDKLVQRLTLAAVREIYRASQRNANRMNKIERIQWIMGAVLFGLTTLVAALHPGELAALLRP